MYPWERFQKNCCVLPFIVAWISLLSTRQLHTLKDVKQPSGACFRFCLVQACPRCLILWFPCNVTFIAVFHMSWSNGAQTVYNLLVPPSSAQVSPCSKASSIAGWPTSICPFLHNHATYPPLQNTRLRPSQMPSNGWRWHPSTSNKRRAAGVHPIYFILTTGEKVMSQSHVSRPTCIGTLHCAWKTKMEFPFPPLRIATLACLNPDKRRHPHAKRTPHQPIYRT